jgi:hypothetical protein
LVVGSKVRFTKHAVEKLGFLKNYGFEISKKQVIGAVVNHDRLDLRGGQFFAVKVLDSRHALRVVYEKRKDYLIVITFYPVKRERYGL